MTRITIKPLILLVSLAVALPALATQYQFHQRVPGISSKNNATNTLSENVFRFRHEKHDTEGWADIVFVQSKSAHYINSELDYRNAMLEAGFDTNVRPINSFRCAPSYYSPSEVPLIDAMCGPNQTGYPSHTVSGDYILISAPEGAEVTPVFAQRIFNREYGVFGNGRWAYLSCGTNTQPVEIGITRLSQLSNCTTTSRADFTIPEGWWMKGTDPKTNKRN